MPYAHFVYNKALTKKEKRAHNQDQRNQQRERVKNSVAGGAGADRIKLMIKVAPSWNTSSIAASSSSS